MNYLYFHVDSPSIVLKFLHHLIEELRQVKISTILSIIHIVLWIFYICPSEQRVSVWDMKCC